MTFQSVRDLPVLIIAYKRLHTTREVLTAVQRVRPNQIFIAFNAPVPGNETERQKCIDVKNLLAKLNWECTVRRLEREEHLSAKDSISGAISWFFSEVEAGIVLEDDCVPSADFFYFCLENLNRYSGNDRVMHISGNSFSGKEIGTSSYHFSNYCHIWGWAGWRRSWQHFDVHITNATLSGFEQSILPGFQRSIDKKFWTDIFRYVKRGNVDTWDTQWLFSIWKRRGISITPAVNLVRNIGFGSDATNTLLPEKSIGSESSLGTLSHIHHPAEITVDHEADIRTADNLYKISQRSKAFNWKIKISAYIPSGIKRKMKQWIRYFYK